LRRYAKLALSALLLALALTLASCGGATEEGQGGGAEQKTAQPAETTREATGMSGTDHSEMNHGSMGGQEMARQMLLDENGDYSDERFIDAMVPHHQGAVEMAEVALENAEHEEIRTLSQEIIDAQNAEIEELRAIKQEEFGTSEVPMEMSDEDMRMMGMMMDPQRLAEERPFDQAFIDNMIPHHRSAIDMARVALGESDNPRIRELASNIVEAQRREIRQMREWRQEWYPEG
jgi:uncharacterized protein (DUF305 family)